MGAITMKKGKGERGKGKGERGSNANTARLRIFNSELGLGKRLKGKG
jgi:hypothetical protein